RLPCRLRPVLHLLISLLRVPFLLLLAALGRPANLYSVARVKSVSEIDASEDGEHIGLEDGNKQFECNEHDRHNKRQWRKDRKQARAKQGYNEAAHDVQRDVA